MYQLLIQRLRRHPEIRTDKRLSNRKRRLANFLLPGMVSIVWLTNSMPGQASETLSEFSISQQTAITRQCTPLQFTQGSDAYRLCLRQNLELTQPGNARNDAVYANLPIDEQYAIQRACANERSTSSTDYSSCTRDQYQQMKREPEPALSAITTDEQYVLAQQCFQTQTGSGARAYRACINTAIAPLANLPKPNFSSRSNLERSNIQLECSISSGDVVTYRKCLLNALGIAFEQPTKPTVQVSPTEINKTETLDTTSGQVAASALQSSSPDNPASTLAEVRSVLPDVELAPEEPRPVPESTQTNRVDKDSVPPVSTTTGFAQTIQKIKLTALDLVDSLQTRLALLKPDHWIALLVTLSLSLLFLIIRSARKANQSDTPAVAGRPDLAPASSRTGRTSANKRITPTETFNDGLPAKRIDKEPSRYHVPEPRLPAEQSSSSINMSFAEWLNNFQKNQQQEFAIEFLIYWMAYADNRYDPTLKQRVFEMKNPDIPNLIKRWVFMKDANAFADAIGFLQSHTSPQQRRQIINLLMALLVNENALTPAQNNLLRFFADAFGIGKTELNVQFNSAYGQLMPAVPRPDKISWWDQITSEQKLRWDARAAAKQPNHIRCRIALGQPLKGELEQESVNKSFTLAMNRCANERVNTLGEREMSLLATQRKKFASARSTLLELMT